MRRNCRRAVKSQVCLNIFFFDDDNHDDDDDDDDDDDVKFLLCLKLFSILLLQFPDMLAMFKMIFLHVYSILFSMPRRCFGSSSSLSSSTPVSLAQSTIANLSG